MNLLGNLQIEGNQLPEPEPTSYAGDVASLSEVEMRVTNHMAQYAIELLILAAASTVGCSSDNSQSNQQRIEDATVIGTFSIANPGGEAVEGSYKIVFSGRYAAAIPLDENGQVMETSETFDLFDLQAMAWFDTDLRRWVDLNFCQQWEKGTIERTKLELSKASDNDVAAFVEASINPRFRIEKKTDGDVVASNSHFTYVITPNAEIPSDQLNRYIAYDRLNAYQKAMKERKLPPTVQLAVDDIMAQEKIFPKHLEMRMKTNHGDVVAATDTQLRGAESTEIEQLKKIVATSQP
jgi:hypothetical protein